MQRNDDKVYTLRRWIRWRFLETAVKVINGYSWKIEEFYFEGKKIISI